MPASFLNPKSQSSVNSDMGRLLKIRKGDGDPNRFARLIALWKVKVLNSSGSSY